jgi:hypothetical protein
MTGYLIGIVGCALLCGAWVLVQRFLAEHDPEAPGIEGGCGSCSKPDCESRESSPY